MKKIILIIILLIGNLSADLVDDGFKEYNNGNKNKTKELWTKACDGGFMGGCKFYKKLNEQGY